MSHDTPTTTTLQSSGGPPLEEVSARPVSETIHKPGTMIGHYKVLELMGEGGFGIVYLAEQIEPVRRRVALKIIKPGMDSKAVIARFEAERQALAMMNHPNIAKVLDAGTTPLDTPGGGRPYFVMEHVKGEPITTYCDKNRLTVEQRLKLFTTVCEAVQHAHTKAIIHRDLKPSNILVSIAENEQPRPVIIDFGVAKALAGRLTDQSIFTLRGQLIGTPEYMSPEQAEMNEADIDTRSDVYSLGVVLYELLTGEVPFDSNSLRKAGLAAIQKIIRNIDPPRPSTKLSIQGEVNTSIAAARHVRLDELAAQLRRELEWIPLKALRKDRTERYRSASELADDVRNYLEDKPLIAGPETTGYMIRKFVKRNKGAVTAISAIAITTLLATAAVLLFALETQRQATIAKTNAIESQRQAGLLVDSAEFVACAGYDPENLTVNISGPLTPGAVRHMSRLPDVEYVWIVNDWDGSESQGATGLLASLQLLEEANSPFKALTEVRLTSSDMTDARLKNLARADSGVTALICMNLYGAMVTDDGVKELARADSGFKSLQTLSLEGKLVTDAAISELSSANTSLKSLTVLGMSSTGVTDEGMKILARPDTGLKSLAYLYLAHTKVTDVGLKELARADTGIRALTDLAIDGTMITDAGLKELARADTGLKALTWLRLGRTQITDKGLKEIARADSGLKALAGLFVDQTKITDGGVRELSRVETGLKALTYLGLSHTQVTDVGLGYISRENGGFKALSELHLSYTQVSDAGLREIARADTGLKALKVISLSGTQITDEGMKELARQDTGLKALKELYIQDTKVTFLGVDAAKARWPGIKVYR